MRPRLRIAACALLFGCSAVVAPVPGEPPPPSPRPAPLTRVSAPTPSEPARAEPEAAPTVRKSAERGQEASRPGTTEEASAFELRDRGHVEPAVARGDAAADTGVPDRVVPDSVVPDAVVPDTAPELVAIAREAFVYSRPSKKAAKLGYLRLGARVKRETTATRGDGCPDGWYAVAPEGFVCAGPTASLDASNAAAELARPRADRDDGLPYPYARSKGVPPPLYPRLPSGAEQAAVEGGPSKRAPRGAPGWEDLVDAPLSGPLAEGKNLPSVFGFARSPTKSAERAVANSAFALLSSYAFEGRRYGLTTDLELVPLDRVTRIRASEFHGLALDGAVSLPVAFVRSRHAILYAGSPERGLSIARPLGFREAVPLGERSVRIGGRRYLETRSGDWLADEELVRIEQPKRFPSWAKGERTWIQVSLAAQTLVAYVGKQPVYATLVSTGLELPSDVEESRATPRGEFLVHTKHVTATMSGDELGDEFDLRDVPYVQYFSGNYAFHAAYWHDAFGTPKSHGCVNLSPADARWLFHFSEPAVPRGWHGAFSLHGGTLVSISD